MTDLAAAIKAAVADQRDFVCGVFDALAAGSTDPAGGITRDTYGPGEDFGHAVMARAVRDSGLTLQVDAAGNSYGWLEGQDPDRQVLMGSHLDSVPRGGNFDGAAGALAGLVTLRVIQVLGLSPRVRLGAMGVRAEESVWFQRSYIGSRAALGTLAPETLDMARRIDTGRTLAEHMRSSGADPEALRRGPAPLNPQQIEAFLELHIEQAPSLVEMGLPLAACIGIPGNFRYPDLRIIGTHGHVGTPRRFRQDAAMAAAAIAVEMDALWAAEEAAGRPMAVTFGRFHTDAGAHGLTTVPGLFHLSLDVRAYDARMLELLEVRFLEIATRICRDRGLKLELGPRTTAPVGPVDPGLMAALVAAAGRLDLPITTIGSPASHDAAAFAAAGVPMAMLFVRNANGSHNPDEAMEIDDFLDGCAALALLVAERWCQG